MPIYSELVNPNERRIKKVVRRSLFVDLIFYLSIALAGYFSSYDNTGELVLLRPPLNGQGKDYAMMISSIATILVLFVAVPVNYNPFRN